MIRHPFKIVVFIGFLSGSLFVLNSRKGHKGRPTIKKPAGPPAFPSKKDLFTESVMVEYKPDINAIEARLVESIEHPPPIIFPINTAITTVRKHLSDGIFQTEATVQTTKADRLGFPMHVSPNQDKVERLKKQISEFEQKMLEQEKEAIEKNLEHISKDVKDLIVEFTTGIRPPPHQHKADEVELSEEGQWLLSDIDSFSEWKNQKGGK